MKRLFGILVIILAAQAALAAGTLTPAGSGNQPIQIREHLVDVAIDNGFARTEVTQVFFNPNAQELEAVYAFPVPASASLSEITIWSGERVLEGEVVEAKEAKRVYTEERDSGNDAGLGECACTRPKDEVEYVSYKVSIARVAANGETKIRFVYYQPLKIDTGVGRYVYPLAEGGTDEVAKSFWTHNPKVEQRFAINVELKSGYPVDEVRVPGAEAEAVVNKLAEGHYKVTLDRTAGDLSRDFVFYYRLTSGFVGATPEAVAQWSGRVKQVGTEGGTNVYAGLQRGFDAVEADRATSIFLVTDGVANEGIVDPKEFHKLLKTHDVRVFGFLMGNNTNWPLMRLIAETSGGFYAAVSNDDDVIGQILLAKGKIASEALHDAKLEIRGVRTFDTTGEAIGKIYRGQQLVIMGRYDKAGPAEVSLLARMTGKDEKYTTTFDFPAVATDYPELERIWAMERIEQAVMKETIGILPPEEAESVIRDVGVKYQLVTDYTSMVVLADDVFEKHGMARNNKERIGAERAAQAARFNAPPVNRRVDQGRPMFSGRSHGVRGGGAFDPWMAVMALAAAAAALRIRR
jgi:hypothetical protein